jgi:hypothetical protein
MSNYFLPMLFGFVGTLAAMVRNIQDDVTESVLGSRLDQIQKARVAARATAERKLAASLS